MGISRPASDKHRKKSRIKFFVSQKGRNRSQNASDQYQHESFSLVSNCEQK